MDLLGCTGWCADGYRETDGANMATPSPGHQVTLNGPCSIDMVDHCRQRTGNDSVLKEF